MNRETSDRGVHRADGEMPWVGEYDLLCRGDSWVALSTSEAIVVRLLLDRYGRVVGRERLVMALWPRKQWSPAQLNQLVARVRRRIDPLGLEIGTVRGRGYVMRPQPPACSDALGAS